ncbi:hypothetical protein [Thalassolituus alkanivorans]|uniref:hypothetical protein n=1 Tax=Thalassolituus alkanivorans TaxID=2881055 RepID=UPI001E418606|nr:hypothetical protein [Thalassolituus alkanivorans]MCB2387322.1 hypothetical protein [Thalassolituus alkanivorans]MCB2424771.1 hypothetical protein [Thalassolituus alkanivorans]
MNIDPYLYRIIPEYEFIYGKVCEVFGEPDLEIETIWFHGTRTDSIESFKTRGILSKSYVKNNIESKVKSLAVGVFPKGNNPFSTSIQSKDSTLDEGPYAVLFKEVALYSPGSSHSYITCPEIVEDLAGSVVGENYKEIVDRYYSATKPYIIAFRMEAGRDELARALWYLHSMADGDSSIEAAELANTCFNSNGVAINPERIVSYEIVI